MEHLLHPGAWLDRFTRRVAFIGLMGLLIVAVVTMVDVLLRWLFSAPIEGYEDITRLLFAIIVASCFPAGLLQGRNITIRFLGKALGQRVALYLEALGAIATFFFFTVVTWQVAAFALDETLNNRFTQTLEITTGPWWWFVSFLLLMCIFGHAARLFR
jgi:TRAP-type C4-dicarboxylate transport system permease small subunit